MSCSDETMPSVYIRNETPLFLKRTTGSYPPKAHNRQTLLVNLKAFFQHLATIKQSIFPESKTRGIVL